MLRAPCNMGFTKQRSWKRELTSGVRRVGNLNLGVRRQPIPHAFCHGRVVGNLPHDRKFSPGECRPKPLKRLGRASQKSFSLFSGQFVTHEMDFAPWPLTPQAD